MAQQKDLNASRAPVLLAPREGAIIDGASLTFVWEPVEGATEYEIEIVSDYAFENVLLSENVGSATSLTLMDLVPPDGGTYYWRIRAKTAAGWSHGEVIESFTSGTPEELAAHVEVPNDPEGYGPLPMLVHAAAPGHALETVEAESVSAGPILRMIGSIALFIAVIVVVLFQLSNREFRSAEVAASQMSGYPVLREARAAAASLLNQYGKVSGEEGVYRIPIQRAMDLMVNETYQQQETGAYSPELMLLPGASQ